MAILWVVALHVGLLGEPNSIFVDMFFRSWTMPFFWIVSGLFLSHQDSFKTFLGKRINNLIVPLCFFVFLTNCLFWVCGDLLGGTDSGWIQRKFHWVSTIQFCWYEGHEDFRNFPLWFLPALFWTSVTYKLIIIISKDKWLWKVMLVAFAVSFVIALCYYSIHLPLFLDDGLYALPYMLFADYIRAKTHFMTSENKCCILIFTGGGHYIICFPLLAQYILWSEFLTISIRPLLTGIFRRFHRYEYCKDSLVQ